MLAKYLHSATATLCLRTLFRGFILPNTNEKEMERSRKLTNDVGSYKYPISNKENYSDRENLSVQFKIGNIY